MDEMKSCRECGNDVSEAAASCPHCGEPYPVEGGTARREKTGQEILQALLVVGILFALFYFFVLR